MFDTTTKGTIIPDNNRKGNLNIAMSGCSNAICWNFVGVEIKAVMIIFNNSYE